MRARETEPVMVGSSSHRQAARPSKHQKSAHRLGACYLGEGVCSFRVWAPRCRRIELILTHPAHREIPLEGAPGGYYAALVEDVAPGTRYFYRLNGEVLRPDPASRFQPETVHGPSEVVDPHFEWSDHDWRGIPLRDYILYELHVGTATREGTFEALIPHLSELRELGIAAIELMPVAQFPGRRNWGYDGVYPFAVQDSYGGARGLKSLVDACHREGLAVVLDVVYNHFGPEGNYLREFGPYFTDSYKTPWGDAINFDGEGSDTVRGFFLENALEWQSEFHLDALRLDAVHAIKDSSAIPFLQELARATHQRARENGRRFYLIAESDLNDARLVRPEMVGGLGLDAQWTDDFHHVLHTLLTGEQRGYYTDFNGVEQLAKVLREGYVYTGEFSKFRKRRHGNPPFFTHASQFVVYSQNHDQIGNRLLGERLSAMVGFEKLRLAAGTVLLSPFLPMLFMGEEYGERAPFQYIVDHGSPELLEAVRRGRQAEFAAFRWDQDMPDPCAAATFERCILNRETPCRAEARRQLTRFYRELIRLRKSLPALRNAGKNSLKVRAYRESQALCLWYFHHTEVVVILFNYSEQSVALDIELRKGTWTRVLDSNETCWGGAGSELPLLIHSAGETVPQTLLIQPSSLAVFRVGETPTLCDTPQ